MATRTYWLGLFTGKTWHEFLRAGGNVSSFRDARRTTVQKIKPGDYLLCYVAGVSRFVGVLEVTSEFFEDTTPIWEDEVFPCRVSVNVVVALDPDHSIPVQALRGQLSILRISRT